jgi:uncharacterized protein (TIGR03437 family)
VQVPFEVAGQSTATIQITNLGVTQPVDSLTVPITASAPSIFEVAADSVGCAPAYPGQTVTLAINDDGTLNGCDNPAEAGSTVTIFVDGFGAMSLPQQTGAVNSSATPLGQLDTLLIDESGQESTVTSAEALVGSLSGVYGVQLQPISGAYQLSYGGAPVLGDVVVQVVIAEPRPSGSGNEHQPPAIKRFRAKWPR